MFTHRRVLLSIYTWRKLSYLTLQFIQKLLQPVDLGAPVLSIFWAHTWDGTILNQWNGQVWYTFTVYNNHIPSKVRIVYTWHTAWLGVKLRGLYSEHLCSCGTVRTTHLIWVNVEIHPYRSEYFIALLYTVELEAENIIWLMSETSYSTDGFHRLKGSEHTL